MKLTEHLTLALAHTKDAAAKRGADLDPVNVHLLQAYDALKKAERALAEKPMQPAREAP